VRRGEGVVGEQRFGHPLSREREAHDPFAHSYMKEHLYDFPSLPLPLVLICPSGAADVLSITFA